MSLRILAILLVLAFATTASSASAYAYAIHVRDVETGDPPSGDYLDPSSGVLYYYDADTSSLVPVGTTEDTAGYYCIDIARNGERPDPCTGRTETCIGTYCVSATAAVANPEQNSHWIRFVVNDECRIEEELPPFSVPESFSGAAYLFEPRTETFSCERFPVEAWLYLDDHVMAYVRLEE